MNDYSTPLTNHRLTVYDIENLLATLGILSTEPNCSYEMNKIHSQSMRVVQPGAGVSEMSLGFDV